MKRVDMSLVDLVHSGEAWQHELPPCSRQVIHLLERNEEVITWVQVEAVFAGQCVFRLVFLGNFALRQPKSGSVEDQFPVIRVGDDYYTLSLRMMKAVWRNVRLRKGFVNKEKAAFGGLKLKIPMLLFVEKMRTQSRFNLMRSMGTLPPPAEDPSSTSSGTERKTAHNASSKVSLVVQRMLFPLLDVPMRTHVLLDAEADQVELDLLDQVGREKPALIEDQQCFLQHLQSLLERYKRRREGPAYTRVAPS